VYLFRTLSIDLDQKGQVPEMSGRQKKRIEKYTTRLKIASGKSKWAKLQALEIISLLNPKNCLSIRMSSLSALEHGQNEEMIKLFSSMPKLLDVGLPAVKSPSESPWVRSYLTPSTLESDDKLYLKSTLKIEKMGGNGRSIVCCLNSGESTSTGTPRNVLFRVASARLGSNVGPENLCLTELTLESNGSQTLDSFCSFLDLLGLRGHRTDFLVSLDLFETSFGGVMAQGNNNLNSLSARSLRHLRIRDCTVIWPLLGQMAREGHNLGNLALTSIEIAGSWSDSHFKSHYMAEHILSIWSRSLSMNRFTYKSNQALPRVLLYPVLQTRGSTLRSCTYRIGAWDFKTWRMLLQTCPSLEEFGLDTNLHANWEYVVEQIINKTTRVHEADGTTAFTKILAKYDLSKMRTWHFHVPAPTFPPSRTMRLAGNNAWSLEECAQFIASDYCKRLESSTNLKFGSMKFTLVNKLSNVDGRTITFEKRKRGGSDSVHGTLIETDE
jgi:hypothetical protein